MSPAKSRSQQRLFQAADHNAQFPMAQKLRASTTHAQRQDFTKGSEAAKPQHVPKPRHPHQNLGGYLHPKKVR